MQYEWTFNISMTNKICSAKIQKMPEYRKSQDRNTGTSLYASLELFRGTATLYRYLGGKEIFFRTLHSFHLYYMVPLQRQLCLTDDMHENWSHFNHEGNLFLLASFACKSWSVCNFIVPVCWHQTIEALSRLKKWLVNRSF